MTILSKETDARGKALRTAYDVCGKDVYERKQELDWYREAVVEEWLAAGRLTLLASWWSFTLVLEECGAIYLHLVPDGLPQSTGLYQDLLIGRVPPCCEDQVVRICIRYEGSPVGALVIDERERRTRIELNGSPAARRFLETHAFNLGPGAAVNAHEWHARLDAAHGMLRRLVPTTGG